ncbi:MAG: sugar-binding protein [Planctomycetota bacterium]|nr:sugar-binding protein [Planctomycetota bacterium]
MPASPRTRTPNLLRLAAATSVFALAAVIAAPAAAQSREAYIKRQMQSIERMKASPKDPPKIAFVTNGVAFFWVLAKAGAEAAAKDTGAVVSVHMPPSGIGDQKRILEDLVVRGVDGIAVSPIDPANQTDTMNNVARRALLVTHDSDAPDSPRLCYIGVDNYEAGRMCGQLLKETLPDGGEIAIFIGRLEQDNARRRRQGLIDELLGRDSNPDRFDPPGATVSGNGFTVVGTYTDQFDRAKAKANVEDVIARYPSIDGMVGLFEYNPPLMLEALERSGKIGAVKVVAFDEAPETLAGIRKGTVHATVVQDPYMYGYRSVEMLDRLCKGDASALPAGGFLNVPAKAIRKSNLAAFEAELAARGRAAGPAEGDETDDD